MPRSTVWLWQQAPFIRLIIPLAGGIVLAHQLSPPVMLSWTILSTALTVISLFRIFPHYLLFRLGWMNGIFLQTSVFAAGMLLSHYREYRTGEDGLGRLCKPHRLLVASLSEPLSEKPHAWKANATVTGVMGGAGMEQANATIILYFKKDASSKKLVYGSKIMFPCALQPIKSLGNPAAFDYARYEASKGIEWQQFLQPGDYLLLPGKDENILQRLLYTVRHRVVEILSRSIPGKKESGLAEALLIGYKDDLDKQLVQSYSNTGVVHIIAISGMHLGLIYWLLNLMLQPLGLTKRTSWLMPVITLCGLWLFALLAGGGPSILRSAIMFSFLVLAKSFDRKTIIYNSLAASAFLLLCINPTWLWDAGFQLSYTAVLSIVVFMKPIYRWFRFTNKLVEGCWKMTSVTLAAQVLTTPVTLFQFHQFPIYFLITNLVAIPLSSAIVLLEIILCAISYMPPILKAMGKIVAVLLQLMNAFIQHMETLPFSSWKHLELGWLETIFLYGTIVACAGWLMKRNRFALYTALVCLLPVAVLRSISFITALNQHRLIVYNLPHHYAIDFISGRRFVSRADSLLLADKQAQQLFLNSTRDWFRVTATNDLPAIQQCGLIYVYGHKKILLVSKKYRRFISRQPVAVDAIIISDNPSIRLAELVSAYPAKQIVLDGSNSRKNLDNWKREAANLGLACFCTVDKGAFVMNMD